MKIDLDIKRTLTLESIVEVREAYIQLFDTYIVHHLDFDSDQVENDTEEDPRLWKWESNKTFLHATIMRDKITGVEYSRMKNSWKVVISISSSQEIMVYFAKKTDAEDLYTAIHNFIIPK